MDLEHPEHLLDHGQLIRSIAAALVRSSADVDDVVQGAYTAALSTARPGGFPLPRWLLGITRNVARRWHRDNRRRSTHELAVAPAEAGRSTAEVLEQEELRRLLISAVLELPQPQRSVVLLRYYDGHPPRTIAVRLGLSAAAVRSHLHRALATLRQRLDRDTRGGRAAWTALLMPLATVPTPRASVAATMGKLAVPVVFAAAAAILYASFREPVRPMGAATLAADGVRPAVAVVAASSSRELVAGALPPVAEVPILPLAMLRFVDDGGKPLPGAAVRERFATTRTEPTVLLLDVATLERGGIEGMVATMFGDSAAWQEQRVLQFGAGGAEVHGAPVAGCFQLLIARPAAPAYLTSPFELPATTALAIDVPLSDANASRVVRAVASEDGSPLAGARLRAFTEFGDDQAFVPGTTVITDANGEATIHGTAPNNPLLIRPAIWWVETDACAVRVDGGAAEITVPRRGACEGRARRDDGGPAAGCTVVFAREKGPRVAAQVDEQGSYRLEGAVAGNGLLVLLDEHAPGIRSQGIRVVAGETKRCDFDIDAALTTIVGRLTAGGVPLPGITVMAGKGDSDRRFATSGADGVYRLEQVAMNSRFAVLLGDPTVSDDCVILGSNELTMQPGTQATRDFDLPRGCVPLRILDDASGAPLEGVPVSARPAGDGVEQERFPGHLFRAGWAIRTDKNGDALLLALPEGEPHVVTAGGRGFTSATATVLAPAIDANAERMVLRVRRK